MNLLRWSPKPDITTFELALCVEMLAGGRMDIGNLYRALPPEALRHWELLDANSLPLFVTDPVEKDAA